jgi:hypothetical protein
MYNSSLGTSLEIADQAAFVDYQPVCGDIGGAMAVLSDTIRTQMLARADALLVGAIESLAWHHEDRSAGGGERGRRLGQYERGELQHGATGRVQE